MEFAIKVTFNISPEKLYHAWLDSTEHSQMTGGEAHVSNIMGDEFTAWDGYISGRNEKLESGTQIIQKWRTVEFADSDSDSDLSIQFKKVDSGTELILTHSNIPEGQPDYEQGWIDIYFKPMKSYFS